MASTDIIMSIAEEVTLFLSAWDIVFLSNFSLQETTITWKKKLLCYIKISALWPAFYVASFFNPFLSIGLWYPSIKLWQDSGLKEKGWQVFNRLLILLLRRNARRTYSSHTLLQSYTELQMEAETRKEEEVSAERFYCLLYFLIKIYLGCRRNRNDWM